MMIDRRNGLLGGGGMAFSPVHVHEVQRRLRFSDRPSLPGQLEIFFGFERELIPPPVKCAQPLSFSTPEPFPERIEARPVSLFLFSWKALRDETFPGCHSFEGSAGMSSWPPRYRLSSNRPSARPLLFPHLMNGSQ